MKRFKNWLLSLFPLVGKDIDRNLARSIKSSFRIFFEGCYEFDQFYETYISIGTFGITDIQFSEYPHKVEMLITLERPGILIGKGGRTIDAIKEYLNDLHSKKFDNKPIEINIKESKLWR